MQNKTGSCVYTHPLPGPTMQQATQNGLMEANDGAHVINQCRFSRSLTLIWSNVADRHHIQLETVRNTLSTLLSTKVWTGNDV